MTEENESSISIKYGTEVIRNAFRSLPDSAGVYRMIDQTGKVLYVGKAKSLKKRVYSYTQTSRLPTRLQRMVAETKSMEFVYTHTEVEALLLESNLIKKHRPPFNILLRDDKSFPYILITKDHPVPRLTKHRGTKKLKGSYFGPFASAGAVNRTITALQRAFLIRNCTDSYFANRKRPCLQYHIKRCTAPCVDYVSAREYEDQVRLAEKFLSGDNREIIDEFGRWMQKASDNLEFEKAARFRDRVRALTSIQSKQDINLKTLKNADVFALYHLEAQTCIQVFFFRNGQNYGNKSYFLNHHREETQKSVMAAFLGQFYENKPLPNVILVSEMPDETELLQEAFGHKAGHNVEIRMPERGEGRRVMEFALRNAREAIERKLLENENTAKHLESLAGLLDMDDIPKRIEVYDNSHSGGENMVGVMIVAGPDGFMKSEYRKFNIREAEKSDDYGMMREVMQRRFGRLIKEDSEKDSGKWPDIILIDGGKGQLSSVLEVLEDMNIMQDVNVAAISKGPDRNAGKEVIFIPGQDPVLLQHNDPLLHYLQRIRDESHRFAIGTHRAKRQKAAHKSSLDEIPGIGPARKKALLHHFGSARAVERAGPADLEAVDGISKAIAREIYETFHGS